MEEAANTAPTVKISRRTKRERGCPFAADPGGRKPRRPGAFAPGTRCGDLATTALFLPHALRPMSASSRAVTPRQLLTFAAVAVLLVLADPQPITYAAGCVLAALGIAVRVWGCGHLRKNQAVVTSGPYAHVKNPLYLGTFLLAAGGVLAAGSPRVPGVLVWAVFGPAFLLGWFGWYLPKKQRVEGARLQKAFGPEYEQYATAVPAFVPQLARYSGASPARWSLATLRSNHELGLDVLLVLLFVALPFAREVVAVT